MTTPDAIAFCDLDDTLFQLLGKCPKGVPETHLSCLSFSSAGEPLSFATPKQARLLRWLVAHAAFVPTTARTVAGLRRAVLPPFAAAVCGFGATILDAKGAIDWAWHAEMGAALSPFDGALEDLRDRALGIAAEAGTTLRATVLREEGLALYLSLKAPEGDAAAAETLRRMVADATAALEGFRASDPRATWTVHANGATAAILPPGLSKERAVARLIQTMAGPDTLTLGLGDSVTDLPFMALCDYAAIPTGSQALQALLGAPSLP